VLVSQLDDGSAHLERANHSLNLTYGSCVADAADSFADVAAINSPMHQVNSHADTGTGTVIVTQQYYFLMIN